MQTNGFALFFGEHAGSRGEATLGRVGRYARRVLTGQLEGAFVLAFSLGQEDAVDLPLVHGLDGAGGEFSAVLREEGGLVARRDALGTKGLYVDPAWSCIATDHRFFEAAPRLLPSGAVADLKERRVAAAGVVPEPSGLSLEEAAEHLAELLRESVRRRVSGRGRVAVSFSGGLDSSLLALLASRETEVVLCSAFAEGSRDKEQTRRAADELGLELVTKELDREQVSRELRSVDLPFRPGEMDLALWSLYSTTSRMATEEGAGLILLGQLADELFGGYMKYALAARRAPDEAASMMRADVAACGVSAFIRDEMACARFSEVRFPFADEDLARFALGLPLEYKIAAGERKLVLRRAASILGLPGALVSAPKKAAQYSSGIAKLVR